MTPSHRPGAVTVSLSECFPCNTLQRKEYNGRLYWSRNKLLVCNGKGQKREEPIRNNEYNTWLRKYSHLWQNLLSFFFFFFFLLLLIFAKWQIKVCRLVFVLFFTRNRNLTLSPVNPIYIISFRGLRVKSLCCHVLGTVSGGHFTRFPEGYDPVFQQLYCFNGVRVAFA